MAPTTSSQFLEIPIRELMDGFCSLVETEASTPPSRLTRASRNCADAPPREATVPSPYGAEYYYCGIAANDMYYGGGNGEWGDFVRGCLVCMDEYEVAPHDAHSFCYGRATERVESFWSTARGYGEAILGATVSAATEAKDLVIESIYSARDYFIGGRED